MEDDIYQNFNTIQNNPLLPPLKSLHLKSYLLIGLLLTGAVLIVLSFIIKSKPGVAQPSSQITVIPVDTSAPANPDQNVVPTQFQTDFKNIDANINTPEDFPPPNIDSKIGL